MPFLPGARGLEKGSAAPIQLPSAGIDKGRGFPKGNRAKIMQNYIKFKRPMFKWILLTVKPRERYCNKQLKMQKKNILRYYYQ